MSIWSGPRHRKLPSTAWRGLAVDDSPSNAAFRAEWPLSPHLSSDDLADRQLLGRIDYEHDIVEPARVGPGTSAVLNVDSVLGYDARL